MKKQVFTKGSKEIESATVTLEDGSTYDADLVVGADGEKVCYMGRDSLVHCLTNVAVHRTDSERAQRQHRRP